MNKILVVAKNPETYFIKRLREEVHFTLFNPWLDDWEKGFRHSLALVRSSGIYQSDKDLEFLGPFKGTILNPLKALKLCRQKSTQYHFLQQHHFGHLPWMDLGQVSLEGAQEWIRKQEGRILVKPDKGQGGWGIEVLGREDFILWWKKQKAREDLDYLIQPYLEETQEYRVFFIKEELFTLLRKSSQGMTANFRQEGKAQIAALPHYLREELLRLIKSSGVQYGAIDLLVKDQRYYILEINTVPGIEQLEKLSGINIIQRLCQVFLSSF